MSIEIIPFRDADLDAAAALLARRHQRDRLSEHALPESFEDIATARSVLELSWQKEGATGVVALRDGHMLGYLIAVPKTDPFWQRSMWVNIAAHAIERDYGAELYRDLYAVASADWVSRGYFAHYILVPASDRSVLDAWFSLSFGQQQAYAIRETISSTDPQLDIRQAVLADRDEILQVIDIVMRHQARSPVYAPLLPESLTTLGDDVDEILADETLTLWIARDKGRVVGFQLCEPASPESDLLYIPEHCIELVLAATREDEQGRGIGRALTHHTLAWAHREGYTHCVTDWRVTNLLSSRFWPRQGFRPVAYRLVRQVDERIVWAPGKA